MPPRQTERGVAAGVVNLGNTCYMNCVLQALAHAPELCMAMDAESHHVKCPVGRLNKERRRSSPSPQDDVYKKRPSRKSKRSSGKKSPLTTDSTSDDSNSADRQFCTLCEFEEHIDAVHASADQHPVAPESFVHGFLDHVAPGTFKLGLQEDSHEFLRLLIDAMQKSTKENDQTYPFKLFRGTVESNVSCSSCHATSSTIDPIEDIGLEVTSTSAHLADIPSALTKFTHEEPLTGYKCDKCGNTGRATKQSRLASVPPILTLHLKRFRYGGDTRTHVESHSRRGNREVSQLLGSSGSAKIEGHAKFDEFIDLQPFLTNELAGKVKKMYCRLFAVIVHAGKNSHSGHYVAYVRNVAVNEWWRMDDARVSRANTREVLDAEAYMLFYRVVDHPIAQELKAQAHKVKEERQIKLRREEAEANATVSEAPTDGSLDAPPELVPPTPSPEIPIVSREDRKRKREEKPEYISGEEWAKAVTSLTPAERDYIRRAEEYISENITFKPDYFEDVINQQAQNGSPGKFSGGVCEDDVQGGFDRYKPALLELLHHISKHNKSFLRKVLEKDKAKQQPPASSPPAPPPETKPMIVPVMDTSDTFL